MNYININEIKVDERIRQCKTEDVEALAASIKSEGLIHPITLSEDKVLIAGGHRLAAFKLLAQQDKSFEMIPYTLYEEDARQRGILREGETLSTAQRKLLEIEENVKRKAMTWQERAQGIALYHRLAPAVHGTGKWTQEQTANLFGLKQAHTGALLRVAKRLENKKDPIWQCESITEAIQFLLKERRKVVQQKLQEVAKLTKKKASDLVSTTPRVEKPTISFAGINFVDNSDEPVSHSEIISRDAVKDFYMQGDCLDIISSLAGQFDHIITDPPYGISMENFLRAESVESVKDTHRVADNLELLPKFLDAARQCCKDYSFLCMWYDLDHHEKIIDWATKAGWQVCRWPLIWCKTSPCMNQAAQYNITKATEVCMIMRASSKAVLAKKQNVNWILADNVKAVADHPFGKPKAVWDYLVNTVSFKGQVLLDPFAGCGSALKSFYQNERVPLGIEVDGKHIQNGINWLYKELNV